MPSRTQAESGHSAACEELVEGVLLRFHLDEFYPFLTVRVHIFQIGWRNQSYNR